MDNSLDLPPPRSRRPGSNASSRSRNTPLSSNGSSTNFHARTQAGRIDDGIQEALSSGRLSSSGLLQERLREKKAAIRKERRRSIDAESLHEEREVQSSPVRGFSAGRQSHDSRRPSSSGKGATERPAGKKGMGVKEMEGNVSTLHKQNFHLKLELFHRRERQQELEERLEAAEAAIAEQVEVQAANEQLIREQLELQGVNDQLLAELEKRDQAVEEAVGIICALEEKVERLEQDRTIVRSFDTEYESRYYREDHENSEHEDESNQSPVPAKQPSSGLVAKPLLTRMSRMPSFLSDNDESTAALRSLYIPTNPSEVVNGNDLSRLPEESSTTDKNDDVMNSPRLSVLSESSFLSVYGEKTLAFEGLDLDERSLSPQGRHRRSLSVERWIDERAPKTTPVRAANKPKHTRKPPFLSLDKVLESPLQRLERLQRQLTIESNNLTAQLADSNIASHVEPCRPSTLEQDAGKRHSPCEVANRSFEHHALPPTPDTISTITLRHYDNSNDSLNHEASNSAGVHPVSQHQQPQYDPSRPVSTRANTAPMTCRFRPHSAGDTESNRPRSNAWDRVTITESEFSEPTLRSASEVSVTSTPDPWLASAASERSQRLVQPPNMFDFGSTEFDDDFYAEMEAQREGEGGGNDWGKDMMFNRDSGLAQPVRGLASPDDLASGKSRDNRGNYPVGPDGYGISQSGKIPYQRERRASLALPDGSNGDRRPRRFSPNPPLSSPQKPKDFAEPSDKNSKRLSLTNKIFGALGHPRGDIGDSSNEPQSQSQVQPQTQRRPSTLQKQGPSFQTPKVQNQALAQRQEIDIYGPSATPPPISRYPKPTTVSTAVGLRSVSGSRPGVGVGARRPNSAGGIGSAKTASFGGKRETRGYERADSFGVDGAGDEREEPVGANTNGQAQGTARKWLNKVGSLRR